MRCARCAAPVEATDEEIPTCDRCRQLLRDRLRPEEEPTVRCPHDDTEMDKLIVHGLVLDRCPTCGGVWLDGGELELLRSAVSGGRNKLARSVVLGLSR